MVKKIILSAMLASSVTALAADNTALYVCKSSNKKIVESMLSNRDVEEDGVTSVEMTVGQDNTAEFPRYELKLRGLNDDGKQVGRAITNSRISLVKMDSLNAASVSYSPAQTPGRENAKAFNLMVTGGGSQISFIQRNNGNAPTGSLAIDCQDMGAQIAQPVAVNLEGKSEAEQVQLLARLAYSLRGNSSVSADEDETINVPNAVADLNDQVATYAGNAKITEEMLQKMDVLWDKKDDGQEVSIDPTLGASRCGAVKLRRYRPIRDLLNNQVAYSADFECTSGGVKFTYTDEDSKVQNKTVKLRIYDVYVTKSQVLLSKSRIDNGY